MKSARRSARLARILLLDGLAGRAGVDDGWSPRCSSSAAWPRPVTRSATACWSTARWKATPRRPPGASSSSPGCLSLGWALTAIGASGGDDALRPHRPLPDRRDDPSDRRRRRPRASGAPRVPGERRAAEREPPPARRRAAPAAVEHRRRRPHRHPAGPARVHLAVAPPLAGERDPAAPRRPLREADRPPRRRRHGPVAAARRDALRDRERGGHGGRGPLLRPGADPGAPPRGADRRGEPPQPRRGDRGVGDAERRLDPLRGLPDGGDRLRRPWRGGRRHLTRHGADGGLADPPLAQTARLRRRRLRRADRDPEHRRPAALAGGPRRRGSRPRRNGAAARAPARRDRAARGHLPLPGDGGRRPARPQLRAARRADGGAGRRERVRQDDPGEAPARHVPARARGRSSSTAPRSAIST